MSKIVVSVDTESKAISVSVDGQDVSDVHSFNVATYDEEMIREYSGYGLEMSICAKKKVGDLDSYVYMSARAADNEKFDGFKEEEYDEVARISNDISKYLGSKN